MPYHRSFLQKFSVTKRMRHGVKIVDEAQESEGVAVAANAEHVWIIVDGEGELAILLRVHLVTG
ncbi:hypothetical protein J6590_061020 [Homalodisca vitripennis]|nr:hypothetical protein J6590_061020 [Homalodisca vitripennis]